MKCGYFEALESVSPQLIANLSGFLWSYIYRSWKITDGLVQDTETGDMQVSKITKKQNQTNA